jgi:hypothetical protein
VRAQGREPPHDIQEVGREPRQRAPAGLRPAFGLVPDEHHEHRDERERDREDQRGRGIARQRPGEDRRRHQRGKRDLRQVGGEVGLERVDALDGRGRELAPPLAGERARPPMQELVHEPAAQLRHHARGPDTPRRLEPGGNEAARERHDGQPHQLGTRFGERRACEEDVRDHLGEQRRLRDDEARLHQAQRDRGDQVRPRSPARSGQPPSGGGDCRAAHEPPCSSASSGVGASPKSSALIRLRKTQ